MFKQYLVPSGHIPPPFWPGDVNELATALSMLKITRRCLAHPLITPPGNFEQHFALHNTWLHAHAAPLRRLLSTACVAPAAHRYLECLRGTGQPLRWKKHVQPLSHLAVAEWLSGQVAE